MERINAQKPCFAFDSERKQLYKFKADLSLSKGTQAAFSDIFQFTNYKWLHLCAVQM